MALTAIPGDGFLGNMNEKFQTMLGEKRSQLECPICLDDLVFRKTEYDENSEKYTKMGQAGIAALTGKDKTAYQKYLAEGQRLNQLPTIEEVKARFNNTNKLVTEFSESARNLLNEKLNSLPPEKRAKLNHLAEVIANNLIKENGATTESDKNAYRMEAWKNLGTSITQGYLYSLCEKAMNPMKAEKKLITTAVNALDKWKMAFDPKIPDLAHTEMQRAAAPRQSVRQAGPAENNLNQGRQQRSSSVANRPAPQNDPNPLRQRSGSVKSSGPFK